MKPVARILGEKEYPQWKDFVSAAPAGSVYSLPEYLDALCRAAGGEFRILAVFQGDEILGGVGLYERTKAAGTYVENRLLLYYNGLVMKEYQTKYPSERTDRHLAALSALETALAERRYARIVLHNRHPVTDLRAFFPAGWQARVSYSYVVPIQNLEACHGRIEQNLRRLITRAAEKGVAFSNDVDFDAFFGMHLATARRKGTLEYLPLPSFRHYFKTLRENGLCSLFMARLGDGRPVAGQLVLHSAHPTTHTVCAAADGEFLNLGVNPFLRWKAFEELSKRGYAANDLTDAYPNPVTRFKSQLGGDLVMNTVLTRPDRELFRLADNTGQWVTRGRNLLAGIYRRFRPGQGEG